MDDIRKKKTEKAIKNIEDVVFRLPITDKDRADIFNALIGLIHACTVVREDDE